MNQAASDEAQAEGEEDLKLEKIVADNMGVYYREATKQYLREEGDPYKDFHLHDMTAEVKYTVKAINSYLTARIAEAERATLEQRIQKLEVLLSLADMYGQYCRGSYGHDFMGAGETAIELLEDYKLAEEKTGVDYKQYEEVERILEKYKSELAALHLTKTRSAEKEGITVSGKEIRFSHTAVNHDMHMFINDTHDPYVCPECIRPGLLVEPTKTKEDE